MASPRPLRADKPAAPLPKGVGSQHA
jgi:hypothetical protein